MKTKEHHGPKQKKPGLLRGPLTVGVSLAGFCLLTLLGAGAAWPSL